MPHASDRINELRARRRRAAVATLVATSGGAVRRLGETMWVDDTGAIAGSVTIGGCVDGRTVEAAEAVLRTGTSQRLSLPLGDEDAWAFGMTCAGNVELIVEPVDPMSASDPVVVAADAVAAAARAGRAAVEIVRIGSRPQRLVVVDDGSRVGSLGSESLDRAMLSEAGAWIDSATAGLVTVAGTEPETELFVRVHAPAPTLLIVGATDVAAVLVKLAGPLGFHTVVIDGRERWASAERFPTVGELHVGMPSELVGAIGLAPSASLVLVSHDFKYDLPVLEVALRSRFEYIGVLGSRRRAGAIREFLAGIGATPDQIARVRVPVGLDIGARTPAEIALSVLAEVVAVRSSARKAGGIGSVAGASTPDGAPAPPDNERAAAAKAGAA